MRNKSLRNWCDLDALFCRDDSWFSLVYWGLTPQQQPGSYRDVGDEEMSVSLVEETGEPAGGNQ